MHAQVCIHVCGAMLMAMLPEGPSCLNQPSGRASQNRYDELRAFVSPIMTFAMS